MNVIIGADIHGQSLKKHLLKMLVENSYTVLDVSKTQNKDFLETTLDVVSELNKDKNSLGIVIDEYGVGSFMVSTKCKGIIAAEVSDERSAYMTREHNNSRLITLGSGIVGTKLAENIVKAFLESSYDGGRHQVRVDMLNKMC